MNIGTFGPPIHVVATEAEIPIEFEIARIIAEERAKEYSAEGRDVAFATATETAGGEREFGVSRTRRRHTRAGSRRTCSHLREIPIHPPRRGGDAASARTVRLRVPSDAAHLGSQATRACQLTSSDPLRAGVRQPGNGTCSRCP
jgi:hypothetical protein